MKDKDADFVYMLKQEECRDLFLLKFVARDGGLLKAKMLLILAKTLLQGRVIGIAFLYGCLL